MGRINLNGDISPDQFTTIIISMLEHIIENNGVNSSLDMINMKSVKINLGKSVRYYFAFCSGSGTDTIKAYKKQEFYENKSDRIQNYIVNAELESLKPEKTYIILSLVDYLSNERVFDYYYTCEEIDNMINAIKNSPKSDVDDSEVDKDLVVEVVKAFRNLNPIPSNLLNAELICCYDGVISDIPHRYVTTKKDKIIHKIVMTFINLEHDTKFDDDNLSYQIKKNEVVVTAIYQNKIRLLYIIGMNLLDKIEKSSNSNVVNFPKMSIVKYEGSDYKYIEES